jgi:predicted transcriptional regulator
MSEVTIPMEQIKKGRWALVPRALQRLEQDKGKPLNLNKLTIEEINDCLVFNEKS